MLLVFVEVEVLGLLGKQALGLVGQVFAALDGFLARLVEARFTNQCAQNSKPLLRLVRQRLESLANVGV